MKKFTCILFVLFCFMMGNSFAYPVSAGEEESSFEEIAKAAEVSAPVVISEDTNTETESAGKEEGPGLSGKSVVFDRKDWKLTLINKQHPIPEDYSFTLGNIKTDRGNMKCDERIIKELRSMIEEADRDGIHLSICSPYRDLARQESLFNRKVKTYMKEGMTYMDAYKVSSQAVTVPGASEHQAGLALDIVCDTYTMLEEEFADTEAGIWLEENCARYGFILRYPKGKEFITGIEFEPWHFRYVGRDAAEIIMEEDICLEEFWDKYL